MLNSVIEPGSKLCTYSYIFISSTILRKKTNYAFNKNYRTVQWFS